MPREIPWIAVDIVKLQEVNFAEMAQAIDTFTIWLAVVTKHIHCATFYVSIWLVSVAIYNALLLDTCVCIRVRFGCARNTLVDQKHQRDNFTKSVVFVSHTKEVALPFFRTLPSFLLVRFLFILINKH